MSEWNIADHIYQGNLEREKEEAAERKLGLVYRSDAQIKEAQCLLAERRAAERAAHTVGGNPIMAGRITGFGLPAEKFGEVVQLLRDKEEQIAKQSIYVHELLTERDRLQKLAAIATNERCKAQNTGQIARYGLAMAVELAKKLVETTSSRSEHEACKAILQAWEELKIHDQGQAAADPHAVGHAAVRHVADCQDERPAGMAGGQPAGAQERLENRAASPVCASDIRQDPDGRRHAVRYAGPGDTVPAGVMLYTAEDRRVYWKDYL